MDAKEIKYYARDQQKGIDMVIRAGVEIRQLQLLHVRLGLLGGHGTDSDGPVSLTVDLDDHVVGLLVFSGQGIFGGRHHCLVEKEYVFFPEI